MSEIELEDENFTNVLNKHWQKFFAKFNEIDTLKISQWKEVHILAYIAKRYEEIFGTKFAISVRGAPSKCTEIYQIKQIMGTLQTTNMKVLKEFIDWTFDNKIIPKKVKLKKIGFFITPGFATEFFLYRKEKQIIKRSTPLPKEYVELSNKFSMDVETYGDLAFIKMAYDKANGNLENSYVQFFGNLEALGFELKILDGLAE